MFIHSSAFCKGFADECVQPNALDITIDFVESVDTNSYFTLRKNGAQHVNKDEVEPVDDILFDMPKGIYSFLSDITVEIPEGVVGWLVSRSSLNRNGVFIMSGVYDAGFKGRVGGTIYANQHCHFEKGARVAQLITAKAETLHLYDGQYQAR